MRILAELRRRWWLLIVLALLLLALLSAQIATFITDLQWFRRLGFEQVFWTLLGTRIGIGVVAALVAAALIAGNLLLAKRLAPPYRIPSAQEEGVERYRELLEPFARPLLLGVGLVIGVLSGLSVAQDWQTVLLWLNRVAFGLEDPQFGRDVGFFVFELPFLTFVNSWLFTTLALTIVLTAVAHYVFGGIRPQSPGQKITPQTNVHLSLLLAALVGVRAWGFVLDQYMLSFSERGTVTGLSYTDVNAQLLAFQLLAIIAAVCVVLFLVNVWFRTWLLPAGGVAILLVAAVVLAGIYPAVIQQLQVNPQELEREQEYIARNLELTRFGFGLRLGEDVQDRTFPATPRLEPEEVEDNETTLAALRMWTPSVLMNTFKQLQERRSFYDFRDVDVDRYAIDDELVQVMLSAREVNINQLAEGAQTWENQRLAYTHGFGLVAADVNRSDRNGDPLLYAQDMPVRGIDELVPDNPRIYYGENSPEYSIVNTQMNEIDYPTTDGEVTYRYEGTGGVEVGSFLGRVAFALRFWDRNLLLSGLITNDSRVLFNRNIRDRIELVAPFLKLDSDPYPAVVDGRIKWIQDAYTTSDMVPYSERVDLAAHTQTEQRELVAVQGADGVQLQERIVQRPGLQGSANYIRNSVKAVVDAYDGTVTLYVVDDEDPLIRAWQRVFPDAFTPADEASENLQAHFRYPEDIFRVQSAVFQTYHIESAASFYRKNDAWVIPDDPTMRGDANVDSRMRPHYQVMRLPGEDEEEFALLQYFSPIERRVLAGWLAARSDGENYGELHAYRMPAGEQATFGPVQLQERLDRDGPLANLIGRWNQSDAQVVRGQILVIPVGDSLLYGQPLFLQQAEQDALPKLVLVVLADRDRIVWSTSLGGALRELYGDVAANIDTGGVPLDEVLEELDLPDRLVEEFDEELPDEEVERVSEEVAELIGEALQRFAEADEALRAGDLAGYASAVSQAEELLAQSMERMDAGAPAAGEPPADEEDEDAEPPETG